ncbi:IS5 family transposase [Algivirga pacifica]|uniref:IS5-like element ISVpa3 family transposase n=1 Tax=Algivirga pacifica TaxID=1162670 RepID=A0ABP9D9C6_9BACT
MPEPKDKYKLKNWKEYNTSLIQRGSLTIWLDKNTLRRWRECSYQDKVVGEKQYTDDIIELCLTLRYLYKLKLRQSTGFLASVFELMGINDIQVPDYTTVSRRAQHLSITLDPISSGEAVNIAIDSTGLKVYGEGEWKVRKHGAGKRRTWQKLHLGVDTETQQIICAKLTTNAIDDGEVVEDLLAPIETVGEFYGDGAYDKYKSRKAVKKKGGVNIVPPQKNGVKTKVKEPTLAHLERFDTLDRIEEIGREEWKKESGYHQRSLSETAMFRYKTIIGNTLLSRKFDSQVTEVMIGCKVLNKFNGIGMPNSFKI